MTAPVAPPGAPGRDETAHRQHEPSDSKKNIFKIAHRGSGKNGTERFLRFSPFAGGTRARARAGGRTELIILPLFVLLRAGGGTGDRADTKAKNAKPKGKTQTRNPKRGTPNPKPQTRKPKPHTRDPKPQTRNPKRRSPSGRAKTQTPNPKRGHAHASTRAKTNAEARGQRRNARAKARDRKRKRKNANAKSRGRTRRKRRSAGKAGTGARRRQRQSGGGISFRKRSGSEGEQRNGGRRNAGRETDGKTRKSETRYLNLRSEIRERRVTTFDAKYAFAPRRRAPLVIPEFVRLSVNYRERGMRI